MGVEFRTKNALLLADTQSAAGTEASPAPGSNAVRVRDNINWSPTFDNIDSSYVQSSISDSAPIIGRGMAKMTHKTWLCGTATGVAADPDNGVLLLGCAMQQVNNPAAITHPCTAIDANTITLNGSGVSSVDDAYVGMPILGKSGFINGQTRVITNYVGSTKVASVYPPWSGTPSGAPSFSIPALNLFSPITAAEQLLTLWGYQHSSVSGNPSRRMRIMDAMGTATITLKTGSPGELNFVHTGTIAELPDDVTRPAAPTYLGAGPLPFIGAQCFLNGNAVKFQTFSLDLGHTVSQFDNPAATYGYDSAEITARKVVGTINPNMAALSSRNDMADMIGEVQVPLWLSYGEVGSGVSIYVPALQKIDDQPGDQSGYQIDALKFQACGADQEVYICFF